MERVSGRHRRNFNFRGAGIIGAAMAIVVVIAGGWLAYQRFSDSGCTGSVKLSVATAPEVAPAVEQTAASWMKSGANVNGTCVAVAVSAVNPALMASVVASEHKVTLTGLGAGPATVKVPDVWVPDSTTWLLRLGQEAPGFQPSDRAPIAQSPVVVAMPQPVAEAVGWPNKQLGYKDLLGQLATSTLRTGIVDPTHDATGLAAMLAIGQAAGAGDEGNEAKAQAIKALASSASVVREDLLQKFPHSEDLNEIATSLSAAPLSEADVIAYNAQRPAVELVAMYMQPSPPPLDYPYAIMPEVDPAKAAAAAALHDQLRTTSFKNALGAAGLRNPDGSTGAGFAHLLGAPEASPTVSAGTGEGDTAGGSAAAGLDASALSQVLGSWAAITLPGRVLAVFDVSYSMNDKVATAGGRTLAQVTQEAAFKGLGLFDDRWAVGVWLFSTNMTGKLPYQRLEPIGPLSANRTKLESAVHKIVPKKGGDTGLYDTTLAAYKEVKANWEPGKINSVILFTDGKNDYDATISQAKLVSELKRLSDPKRPVRLVIIGIGTGVDRKELETITDATSNGGVFIASDPAKIDQIFLQAIAARSGAGE
jgi:von Willebrand factor type A domain-containing protein